MAKWTDAELAEARRLRREGDGATVIARKLKRTRNSIIGKLHKAGEPGILVNSAKRQLATLPSRKPTLKTFSWQQTNG